jgi:hypothetical protein
VFGKNEIGNAFWEKLGFGERGDLVYRNKVISEEVLLLRHEISSEREDAWRQIETFCRYPVGIQSHPIMRGKQSEASLACSWGDSPV